MKLNHTKCGTSRPLTGTEAAVLIVIIIVAGALAAAGWPAVSMIVVTLKALSLGYRLLMQLRRGRTVTARPVQA
ncbi:hypothetical protein [Streptomyces sp. NPDC005573]|uniref:hypothetical protein n=1 Tax=unclassified Streptomyces TaxID=2593676 RepID=UPI0033A107E6